MPRSALESDMDIELDNHRLSSSYSTSSNDDTMMSGVIPQGSKLFGCMFIFFVFSGGFVGSLFALDTFEDPDPYLFNARILKFPGITEDNCMDYNVCSLTGVVQLRPVQNEDKEYTDHVKVKLTANGVMGNITMVEIHDVSAEGKKVNAKDMCNELANIGAPFYKQAVTKLESVIDEKPEDQEGAFLTIRVDTSTTSATDINFKYVHGDLPYINNYAVHASYECGAVGEVKDYGRTLEIVRPLIVTGENVTGTIAFSVQNDDDLQIDFNLNLHFSSDEEAAAKKIKYIKVFDADTCEGVNANSAVFSGNGDVYKPTDLSSVGDVSGNYAGNVLLEWANSNVQSLFNHAVGVFDPNDDMIACNVLSGSVFEGNNITSVGEEVTLGFGYEMEAIQKKVLTLSNNANDKVIACGIVPGNPYRNHEQAYHYSHEPGRGKIENSKRVTTEFEIETGYEFEDFEGKIVVLLDDQTRTVACGVFVGTNTDE
jgi:hypothetical protein